MGIEQLNAPERNFVRFEDEETNAHEIAASH